jgi:CHAT domain-containing protein
LSEVSGGVGRDRPRGVLLVADPAFSGRDHPLLNRLPNALEEAQIIARSYAESEILERESATRASVEAALARAEVVHFSGHAVFEDQRPERSYLVLARDPMGSEAGTITAAELSRLDLTHVRLVVLSACQTVRSSRNRAGGFTGLAGSLLAAGVMGTIGSLWNVDDRATSMLMAEFHRAYTGGLSAPAALRHAQLAALRSGEPTLRTPASWAAFRYAGR